MTRASHSSSNLPSGYIEVVDQHTKRTVHEVSEDGRLPWREVEDDRGGVVVKLFIDGDTMNPASYRRPLLRENGFTQRNFTACNSPLMAWATDKSSDLTPKTILLLDVDGAAKKVSLQSQSELELFFSTNGIGGLAHPESPDELLVHFSALLPGVQYIIQRSSTNQQLRNLQGFVRNTVAGKELEAGKAALTKYQELDASYSLRHTLREHFGDGSAVGQTKEYDYVVWSIQNDRAYIGSVKSCARDEHVRKLVDDCVQVKERSNDPNWPTYAAFSGKDVRGSFMADLAEPGLDLPARCKELGIDLFERSGSNITFRCGPSFQ